MGMTIDESIGWMQTICDMRRAQICISDRLVLETAIDTMRKYQKIQAIVEAWNDNNSFDSMVQISEVVEDGND